MPIHIDQIEHLAHLARLDIGQDDFEHYRSEISQVIDLVSELKQVDTSGIQPMSNPHHAKQILRDDIAYEQNERDVLQESAPHVEDGLYLVPNVMTD